MSNQNDKWMASVDDGLRLDQLCIPGTHDTGTAGVSDIVKGTARTQNFGVARQLSDGVRFLDIRLKKTENATLDVYHGIVSCNLSFDSVLSDCKTFLAGSSKEVIIMLIDAASKGDRDEIEAPFLASLDRMNMRDQFALDAKVGTLGTLRGKIVLFRRFDTAGTLGVDLTKVWPDDTTGQGTNGDGLSFDIEDHYSQHDTHEKWAEVKCSLDRAIAKPTDGVYHITYNSIAVGGHTPYQYAWGGGLGKVEPKMNPTLDDYLVQKGRAVRFGCVMTDFYNNHGDANGIVDKLIAANS